MTPSVGLSVDKVATVPAAYVRDSTSRHGGSSVQQQVPVRSLSSSRNYRRSVRSLSCIYGMLISLVTRTLAIANESGVRMGRLLVLKCLPMRKLIFYRCLDKQLW